MPSTATVTDQIIYDESGSAVGSISHTIPELTPTYQPGVGPINPTPTTATDATLDYVLSTMPVRSDWDRVVQAIPALAARMLETVIYPYEDIVMTLDDYLHVDEGDAQALGVVLLNGNRFSRISDIRGDEIQDTKIAILTKILEQLIPEIRKLAENPS